MEKELSCERCNQRFTIGQREPILLPDCGHTICAFCIADMLYSKQSASPLTESNDTNPLICPSLNCNVPVSTTDPDKFMKNQQLLRLIELYNVEQARKAFEQQPQVNMPTQSSIGQQSAALVNNEPGQGNITCGRHPDKPIEYFCRTCTHTVCVKCIFDEHNGHELV